MREKFKKKANGTTTVQVVVPSQRKKNNKPKNRRPKGLSAALDRYAREYATLLMDPCHGPTVHPIFPGGTDGYVSRFESEATLYTALNDTAASFLFVPGAIPNSFYSTAGLAASGTTGFMTSTPAFTGIIPPGLGFLTANASACRCISACMQISWPGSELNRQGMVSLGQSTGALGWKALTTAVSADGFRPLCELKTRMPDSLVEVKLSPSSGDFDFTDPAATSARSDTDRCAALIGTVSGLNNTTSTGVRIRLVATYEWIPIAFQGIVADNNAKQRSANTYDDVLNAVNRANPRWAYSMGKAASLGVDFARGFSAVNRGGTRMSLMRRDEL